ncbi:MAG TPA: S8 family serine peptidase [Planococcus sp. (in: firmicutes)]|nr:S8 family serine peptidase [Planococcus sp. (in: firmicutes)]
MKRSGKLLTTCLLAASLLVPAMGVSANGDTSNTGNGQENFRVLIDAKNKNEKANLKDRFGVQWEFEEEGFTTEMNENQFKALQKNKNINVEKVPKYTIEATSFKPEAKFTATAAAQSTPWGIRAIYNNNSLTSTSGGSGINIAVLDTGVNVNHPDLANNVRQCKDFTFTRQIRDNSCTDRQGHGTHVAGSAMANGGGGSGVYGVAPQANLWAYKVLGDNGSGSADDIATAIRHAADQAVSLNTKVVINLSLGSSVESSLITNAINYAYSRGVLVVAAAGNTGPAEGTIGYPGAVTNAIAVAALENTIQNGTHRVADFSSRGFRATAGDYVIQKGDVEISAPGAAVYSTWYNGGYATISGTSMASPHIAGLAAKVWSQYPTATNTQLRGDLQSRAYSYDILSGIGAGYGDDYASGFGFARVN